VAGVKILHAGLLITKTMKRTLLISLLANLLLSFMVCYQVIGPRPPRPATGLPSAKSDGPIERYHRPLPSSAASLRFDWRQQVESADYPTYIANLRAIHCPEQTVRDIIKTDVANLFAQKRRECLNSPAIGRWSPAEEQRLVAFLFNDPVPESVDNRAQASALEAAEPPVKIPLVMQTQALATLKLNDEQKEELSELAQQFIQEVGGLNQDPNDPAYLVKWQKAQPKFDELIVRTIGSQALVDLDVAIPALDSSSP
jgi:hypothetical protein